ncbi:hypothetical protein ACFWDI_08325 [Streptomyces sp. NPDC060064]|uniref:hypothetical protein n=1 Tax=Streptomyces sp. NPDC060064 TaxID=3347049 RepID=UPI0036C3B888
MWKPPESIAQRFPLIARPCPACLPLPQRVHTLTELAASAATLGDPSMASTVYNQAALIASDVGDPDTAREMCHQHAAAYLHAAPLPGTLAIRALEPVVNLARLQLRAGQADDGRQRLLALFEAVSTGSPVQVEDIAIPADLVETVEDRQEVRAWLCRVLLADGTRALTAAGRWAEALAHVEAHRGVGQRMLDGRQVAVLAALASGNTLGADILLTHTEPGEAWEGAVTDCLTVLCRRTAGRAWRRLLEDLVTTYLERPGRGHMTVLATRLGLAVLDVVDSSEHPAARLMVADLYRRTMKATDGYAALGVLNHHLARSHLTSEQRQTLDAVLTASGLGAGNLSTVHMQALTEAVEKAEVALCGLL